MATEMQTANQASNLPSTARRIALKAIEDVHIAYYEKGGIRDTAESLKGQLDSVGKHVFTIAKHASKQHPRDIAAARRLYLAMCEYAETEYKAQHDVENLRDALPTWATLKSNVLRGLRLGLNPNEVKSERVYRSRVMERVSRSRTARAEGGKGTGMPARAGPPTVRSEDEIGEFIETTVVPEALKQLVAQVVFAVEVVLPSRIAQAEEILRETWQRLGSLTDKRKMRG